MKMDMYEKTQRNVSLTEVPLSWPKTVTKWITFWLKVARPVLDEINERTFSNFWLNSLGTPCGGGNLLIKFKTINYELIGKKLTFLDARHVCLCHPYIS